MAPVLASSTAVVTAGATMGAVTVTTGDVLIFKCQSEDQGAVITAVVAAGQTFTNLNTDTSASHTGGSIWGCTVTGSPGTVTVTFTAPGGGFYSAVVERWTGAQLAGTPATNATKLANTGNGFTGSITTAAANSAVTWVAGDWSANAPGTPAYLSSATGDGIHDVSPTTYVAYYATQAAGSAGAQSFGLTTPVAAGTWKYLAVEVQAAGAAPVVMTTPLVREFAIQRAARW